MIAIWLLPSIPPADSRGIDDQTCAEGYDSDPLEHTPHSSPEILSISLPRCPPEEPSLPQPARWRRRIPRRLRRSFTDVLRAHNTRGGPTRRIPSAVVGSAL